MSEPSKSPSEGRRNEAILGPFTFRDLTLFGGVLVTFVGSLLPLWALGYGTMWNSTSLFFIGVGFLVPAAAAALFAWRRLEPTRSLRVGSLSVDQFASVAAVLCASFYFVFAVTTLSPGGLVGLLGGLAMLAATTLARVIPQFAGDFDGRAEVPAHIVARDAVAPVRRPKPVEASIGNGGENAGAAGGGNGGAKAGEKAGPLAGAMAGFADMKARLAGGKASASRPGSEGSEEAGFGGRTAVAPVVGAGAVGAGALSAGAWAGHADDAAWGRPEEPSGTSTSGTAKSSEAVGSAGLLDAGQPTEIGAADLLAPAADEPFGAEDEQHARQGSGAAADAAGTGSRGTLGAVSAGDAAALEATEAHLAAREDGGTTLSDAFASPHPMRPADDNQGRAGVEGSTAAMSTIGDADGEVYGAPESFADNATGPRGESEAASEAENTAGPATAVFPASSGRDAQPQAPTDHGDIGATRPYEEPGQSEAFWFAVSQARSAVDPSTGRPVFSLHPGQWILALQDRGHEFVVQSPDGRIGILRELSGIERG
ncbi:hypothetical protein RBS60_18060 [Sinomonas sp. ASV486]|uniref:hypothetical protein n=1 Tax=Sinomonas sp. ASV486 TaxID=3051170 RepID=UPI0027DAFBA0|nr:hypothetical protein [Sinomonas sp. ASV486]MDQ4492110.1 hypothetical protein [Sinomonas sp. ASV486]